MTLSHLAASASPPAAALLKTMGEQGKWALAEQVFSELEREQLTLMRREAELEANSAVSGLTQGLSHAVAVPSAASSSAGSVMSITDVYSPPAVSSSSEAIAAAAAAVAALAAAQRSSALHAQHAQQLGLQPADDTESLQETRDAAGVVTQSLGQVLDAELDAASVASGSASPLSAASSSSPFSAFSYFTGAVVPSASEAAASAVGAAWTSENAALQGLQLQLSLSDWSSAMVMPLPPAGEAATLRLKPLPKGKGPVNEVVCGALMLAYERGGKWEDAVAVLGRARTLGITPNTIMYNTAMSALGKAGKSDAARALFDQMHHPGGQGRARARQLWHAAVLCLKLP